jgi:hypothetical protein
MLKLYPTLLSDNERMREIGLERWIEEQEARAGRGFVYSDIRHPQPWNTAADEKDNAAE